MRRACAVARQRFSAARWRGWRQLSRKEGGEEQGSMPSDDSIISLRKNWNRYLFLKPWNYGNNSRCLRWHLSLCKFGTVWHHGSSSRSCQVQRKRKSFNRQACLFMEFISSLSSAVINWVNKVNVVRQFTCIVGM